MNRPVARASRSATVLAWLLLSLLVVGAGPARAVTQVISVTPAPGAWSVLPATTIVVRFDQPIDPATVTASSLPVAGGITGPHPGAFSFGLGDREITLTPSAPFAKGETVIIDVSSQIKDTTGAAIRPWASQFTVLSNPSAGEFAWGVTYPTGDDSGASTANTGIPTDSVAAGDVDGDGRVDAVVASSSANGGVWLHKGRGDGTFEPKVHYLTATNDAKFPAGVRLGDVNNDGKLDAIVAHYGANNVAVLLNDGAGGFLPPQSYPVNQIDGRPVHAEVGDLDGDGHLDITAGAREGVYFLFGVGDGTFLPPVLPRIGPRVYDMKFADCNGDGLLDMVNSDLYVHTLSVWINLGNRTFAAPVAYPVDRYPHDLFIADLDGDGVNDIVVACEYDDDDFPPHGNGMVNILRGVGDGTFGARLILPASGLPFGLVGGDFNGDGHPDFAITSHYGGDPYPSASATVFVNNGAGSFIFQKILNTLGSRPVAIVAADFDLDGKLDLMTANAHSNTISFFQNAAASISGLAYFDADTNCTQNGPDEIGVGGRLVRVTDRAGVARYGVTRGDGTFVAVVPAGSYQVSLVHSAATMESCHNGQGTNYGVTVTEGSPVGGLRFGLLSTCHAMVSCEYVPPTGPCPLCSVGNTQHVRLLCPCDKFKYRVKVKNDGVDYIWIMGAKVRLDLDANVGYELIQPNPLYSKTSFPLLLPTDVAIAVSGEFPNSPTNPDCNPLISLTDGIVEWTVGVPWPPNGECEFDVNVRVAAPLNTWLMAKPSVVFQCGPPPPPPFFPPVPTYSFSNVPCMDQVLCSYDPNDKLVSPAGCGPFGNVPPGTALTYLVRFQNLGNAPALRVLINDHLDSNLEADTLEILATSHPLTDFQILPGGQMIFTFDGINLPDATSDQAGSRGEVRYRIRPKSGAGEGAVILNTAAIYFDRNPPIITVTTTNTIRVRPEPVAAFTARHSETQAGVVYDFTYAGDTSDGAAFTWEFGSDATPPTATDRDPAGIQFSSPGPKEVRLTVVRYGCRAGTSRIVYVTAVPLVCPSNLVAEATSPQGVPVSYAVSPPPGNPCAGVVTNECLPPSGGTFPTGVTVVNCLGYDDCGNTNACSFTVSVVPSPLGLTCAADKTVSCDGATVAGNVPDYVALRSFSTHGTEGQHPRGVLWLGNDGALYGTTTDGGSNGQGTVFKVNSDGSGHTVLRHFAGGDGENPSGGLVEGFDGALYGTTDNGGLGPRGTVFKLNKDGSGYTVLRSFGTGTSGQSPAAGLIQGHDGRLYGTARAGGGATNAAGTVFRMETNGANFTVLHTFLTNGVDGRLPLAPLVQGAEGLLYGTTYLGGSDNMGTVFKLNTDGGDYSVLKHFTGAGGDGERPYAGLAQGSDGLLYGTTWAGGTGDRGTVFKLKRDGSSYTVLRRFSATGAEGGQPYSALVEGADGALYGTTYDGGTNDVGTLFRLNKDGGGFTVLRHFQTNDVDGRRPFAGLARGSDGALYGTTLGGGRDRAGTVFKLEWPCPWSFDAPSVVNACGGSNVTLAILSTVTNGTNPQRLTRTWTATDACGHGAQCSQTVTVISDVPPLTLAIRLSGGAVVISWTRLGTLEQSPLPFGPWTPVVSATNSYATTPGGSQTFYRVRVP